MDEAQIITALRNSFANDNIKQEVLTNCWYELNIEHGIDSMGFCVSASQVLYHLTGGTTIWQMRSLNDPRNWNNGTHYFLQRRRNGEIVDITSDQYTIRNIEIPYASSGFGITIIAQVSRTLARLSGLGEL